MPTASYRPAVATLRQLQPSDQIVAVVILVVLILAVGAALAVFRRRSAAQRQVDASRHREEPRATRQVWSGWRPRRPNGRSASRNRRPSSPRWRAAIAVDRLPYDELPPTPSAWSERADRVQAVIAAEHGTDPRYRVAQDQQQRIAGLLADGAVGGELVHARPADRS